MSHESALAAITKYFEEQERAAGIVRIPAPRDWVPCDWCGGSAVSLGKTGCVACFNARETKKKELDAEYARQFPEGPKPFYTVDHTKPGGWEEARRVVGVEALEKAFGPGGGGAEEIQENARREVANRPRN